VTEHPGRDAGLHPPPFGVWATRDAGPLVTEESEHARYDAGARVAAAHSCGCAWQYEHHTALRHATVRRVILHLAEHFIDVRGSVHQTGVLGELPGPRLGGLAALGDALHHDVASVMMPCSRSSAENLDTVRKCSNRAGGCHRLPARDR